MWSAGLGGRIGDQVGALAQQPGQGLQAGFVPVGDLEAVTVVPAQRQTFHPALLAGLAQHIAGALVTSAQLRTDQRPAAEPERAQVVADLGEVVVAELGAEHREQLAEPSRAEVPGLLAGYCPQRPEVAGEEVQDLHRPVQDDVGGIAEEQAEEDFPLTFHRTHRQVIQPPDHRRAGQAVGQDLLPVGDGSRIGQPIADGPLRHVEQELVAGRHGVPQRAQFQVLGQVRGQRRRIGGQAEVRPIVHEKGFHRLMRSFTRS